MCLPISGEGAGLLQYSFFGSGTWRTKEDHFRLKNPVSQKVLSFHAHSWLNLLLKPWENHQLEYYAPSRLLSQQFETITIIALLDERENQKSLSHSLAQHVSAGPYQAQGTAFASRGDTMSIYTRMFTLHERNITRCWKKYLLNGWLQETAEAEFSHLVNYTASSPGSFPPFSRSFSTQQPNTCF